MDPFVQVSENDDGSADFTVSVDDEDHRFSLSVSGEAADLSYEETLSWRGEIRSSEPREEIFRLLIQSDEMTVWMEQSGVRSVRRDR